ncbi:MAG: WYL domain-containing protein [Deltaproteobacteria bacterium]|nr:WYL domain-containing protein [Deltaproteobacteria bacterium]
MPRTQSRAIITRILCHVRELSTVRRGLRAEQLAERAGISRATAYRDIQLLMDTQIPITTEVVNGETRYLLDWDVPPLKPTPLQLTALIVLRNAAEPLRGTQAFKELDGLVRQYAKNAPANVPLTVGGAGTASARPEVVTFLDRAAAERRCVRLLYQSASAFSPSERIVEPREMRMVHQQLYVTAWDRLSGGWRVFKPSRAADVVLLPEKAPHREGYDAEKLFAHSVGVWNAPSVAVAVRIDPSGGRFVNEWPLTDDQQVERQADGGAVVRATVAGLQEVTHWVLNWGAKAEVLEPPELRVKVRKELAAALSHYGE